MAAAHDVSETPKFCGPYELLARIGKGGMASVYLARGREDDPAHPNLVAVKVLHPHLAGQAEYIDMLMDEAKVTTGLRHPNVVETLEVGRDGSLFYLVCDYVEGAALDRLLRRSKDRRPELIVPVVIDALYGLHAAHGMKDEMGRSLEVVHRDVTPGNVLVGVDGIGRISDFGVAKARARITKTNPGIVKGKAGYIAPEVILGRDVDARADVFSMGVLLWNALTGKMLFDKKDLASSLTSLLKSDIPPPSRIGRQPSALFDGPIMMALSRDPANRHESALEMAEALADALLLLPDVGGRDAVGAWVYSHFAETLDRRQVSAMAERGRPWDAENVEPLSTSALVRKDPTGRILNAIPEVDLPEVAAPPAAGTPWLKLMGMTLGGALALAGAGALGAMWADTRRAPEEAPAPAEQQIEPDEAEPDLGGAEDLERFETLARDEGQAEPTPRPASRRMRPAPASDRRAEPSADENDDARSRESDAPGEDGEPTAHPEPAAHPEPTAEPSPTAEPASRAEPDDAVLEEAPESGDMLDDRPAGTQTVETAPPAGHAED
ncbi:MAG: protein kinase [Sandaracinaceae bacterium]